MPATTRYNTAERAEPTLARPHHVNPSISCARVILAVKNFAAIKGVCHIGLGVTASNTVKVLRRNGVNIEAWAVQTTAELEKRLAAEELTNHPPVTHVIVSAPSWIQPGDFGKLCFEYPNTEFVQLNHSGCAFLSIDKFGIRNIREAIDLEMSAHNMRVAANNPRVSKWLSDSFGFEALLLPNLYNTESYVNPVPPRHVGDTLRIGSFGRPPMEESTRRRRGCGPTRTTARGATRTLCQHQASGRRGTDDRVSKGIVRQSCGL